MLNPEGGKTGKAPRRRAASMDNSSKLLKSRMRAKQTKKQAGAAGLGGGGGSLQSESSTASAGADSPNSSQQFPKWGVNSSSPSSRGSLDDADMWTTFRPRTSSNASTLSGRLSPIAPGQEDDDNLPEEGLLGGYSASSLPPTLAETLMEELDLIDGLTLMTAQQGGASPSTAPPAPPTPLPSASTLLPRGSSFSSFHPSSLPQAPTHTGTQASVSQCGPSNAEPSGFSNSLFTPMHSSSSRGSGHYSTHVPSSLEALLTSDSPPPNDVIMTQVDPLMASPGGVGLMGLGAAVVGGRAKPNQLLLGKALEPNTVAPMTLQAQLQPQQHHLHKQQQHQQQQHQHHSQMGLGMILSGMSQDPSQLSVLKAQHTPVPAVGPHHAGAITSANPSGSLQVMGQFGAPSCFPPSQDRLPTDLDIEMFTENLDCDVDYIINSDLMDGDGIDFNFDPILPGGQGYAGPASTQGSAHNWVPS